MSKSLSKFQITTERIIAQMDCFDNLRTFQNTKAYLNSSKAVRKSIETINFEDIARSNIVFAVASMDTYYTDIFIEILVPFLKKHNCSEEMEKLLINSGISIKDTLSLLSRRRPFRRIRTIVSRHLEEYVTQNFSVIDKLFKCYGLKSLSKSVEAKCHRKNMLKSINKLTARRHKIVHQADLNKRGNPTKIRIENYLRNLADMEKFVSTSDEILSNLIK